MTTTNPNAPKQRLRQHIVDHHRRPHGAIGAYTMAELQRFHREQHHHFLVGHAHAGVNAGPSRRPPGWSTGDDMIKGDR
jgi:hypothetical protein